MRPAAQPLAVGRCSRSSSASRASSAWRPSSRATVGRLVADLRRYSELAHERPAGEVLYAFLKGSGLLARVRRGRHARRRGGPPERRPLLRDRPRPVGAPGRRPGRLRGAPSPDADRGGRRSAHGRARSATPTPSRSSPSTRPRASSSRPSSWPAWSMGASRRYGRREGLQISGRADRRGATRAATITSRRSVACSTSAMTRARDELILSHAADYGGRRARRVSPFVLEALDLPLAAGTGRRRRQPSTPLDRSAPDRLRVAHAPANPAAGRAVDRAAVAQLLPGRRLPDLPREVQVRARPAGADRAAPLDHLWRGPPRGGPGVPPRHARGEVMTEAELIASFEVAWSNEGFLNREHESARLEAGRAALRRFRSEQLEPDAVIPAYVERDFAFTLNGDRIRGRWDRVDVEPRASVAATGTRRRSAAAAVEAGLRSPTSSSRPWPLLPPGARHDHGLQVERRARSGQGPPARPRFAPADDLRDGLAGDDRPPARRGTAAASWNRAWSAGPRSTTSGWPRARPRSRRPRAGSAPGTSSPRPDPLACSYCAFREICPASAAPARRIDRWPNSLVGLSGDHLRLRQHARAGAVGPSLAAVVEQMTRPSSTAAAPFDPGRVPRGLGRGARPAVRRGRARAARGRSRPADGAGPGSAAGDAAAGRRRALGRRAGGRLVHGRTRVALAVDAYSRAFVAIVSRSRPTVRPMLERLAARYRLGVLSNWPLAVDDRRLRRGGWLAPVPGRRRRLASGSARSSPIRAIFRAAEAALGDRRVRDPPRRRRLGGRRRRRRAAPAGARRTCAAGSPVRLCRVRARGRLVSRPDLEIDGLAELEDRAGRRGPAVIGRPAR